MDCPSLRALNQFGFEIPYSTLKNYFGESRTLPEKFFNDLCYLSKLNKNNLNFDNFHPQWGKLSDIFTPYRVILPVFPLLM